MSLYTACAQSAEQTLPHSEKEGRRLLLEEGAHYVTDKGVSAPGLKAGQGSVSDTLQLTAVGYHGNHRDFHGSQSGKEEQNRQPYAKGTT